MKRSRRAACSRAAWLAVLLALLPVAPVAAEDTQRLREHLEYARYPAAVELGRQLLAKDPGLAHAWYALGTARAAGGELEQAVEDWREAAALGGPGALGARVALARRELVAGNPVTARAALREVLARLPDPAGTDDLMAAGEAASLLGRYDPGLLHDAIDFYRRASERAPDDAAPRVALAELLLDKYNNAEASALLQQALADHPEHPRLLLALARSLLFDHSNHYAPMLARALAAAPGLVEAHVLAARAHLDLGETEHAQAALDEALARNPRSVEAMAASAALAFVRDDSEAMESWIRRAAELAPNDASAWVAVSEAAAAQRRYSEAAYFAVRAAQVDAWDWRAHGLAGSNALRRGNIASGRASIERAFKGDPFNAWFKNTLDLLDELDGYASLRRDRFHLLAAPAQVDAIAPLLMPLAEQAHDHFAQRYGLELPGELRIELYPEQAHLSVRTLGLIGTDLLGVSFGPVVAMDSPTARPHGFNWGAVLWHEMAHSFHLYMTASRVPRWFSEGLAVHEEHLARPGWGSDVDLDFLFALRAGELQAASGLDQSFLRPRSPAELGHAYVQAGLVLELVEEMVGSGGIVAMLNRYRDGQSTAEVFGAVLGFSPEAFDRRFDDWLRARYAPVLDAMEEDGGEGGGRYVALLRAGWQALESGDHDAAQRALLAAYGLFPTHAGPRGPLRGLARLALSRGDDADAAYWLRRLVAVDADDLDAFRELAGVERRLGDHEGLARTLHASLYLQPFDADVRAHLADHYERAGDWLQAVRERAAVAALDPADRVTADYLHARALVRAGQPDAARPPLLRALRRAPLYEPALDLLLELRHALDADG